MIVDIVRNGKKYKAEVPADAPKNTWQFGLIKGPPDMSSLGLPPSIEVRLHNELFARGLITGRDVKKRAHDVQGALQAALKIDATTILNLYG